MTRDEFLRLFDHVPGDAPVLVRDGAFGELKNPSVKIRGDGLLGLVVVVQGGE